MQVVHTSASVTKQYILILTYLTARKVMAVYEMSGHMPM